MEREVANAVNYLFDNFDLFAAGDRHALMDFVEEYFLRGRPWRIELR